jgi:hypothetical protein
MATQASGVSLTELLLLAVVVVVGVVARQLFRRRHLGHRQRVALSCVAVLLMGALCVRPGESSAAGYCMIGFGTFVLVTSLFFLRRFERETAAKKDVGSG